jgi:hypothetical protein
MITVKIVLTSNLTVVGRKINLDHNWLDPEKVIAIRQYIPHTINIDREKNKLIRQDFKDAIIRKTLIKTEEIIK